MTLEIHDPQTEAILREYPKTEDLTKEFARWLQHKRIMEDIAAAEEEFRRGESLDIAEAVRIAKASSRELG